MKQYMVGTYNELHFIAERRIDGGLNRYFCMPKYSKGNSTDMTFFADRQDAKFYDTLEEAKGKKYVNEMKDEALEEERQLTGYYHTEDEEYDHDFIDF